MANHHPAKFGLHRHCGSKDMMLLVVDGKDSACLFISEAHDMSCSHM